MLNNIYLFKHANYYNRIVKRFDHLNEYVSNSNLLASYSGINFNPNDGVSTNLVINYNEADMPDYLIVADEDIILSRWYIIESRRTRSGQFSIDLYRDVIADWYEDVIKAPCFIEKATVGAVNDPAIFNNEDMAFNQIKTSETLLKDKIGCGWYVGYYAKGTVASGSIPKEDVTPSNTFTDFSGYPYDQYSRSGLDADFSAETLTATYFYDNYYYFMKGWDPNGLPKAPTVPARPDDYPDLGQITGAPDILRVSGYKCGYKMRSGGPVDVAREYDRLLTSVLGIDWYTGLNAALPSQPEAIQDLLGEDGKYYNIDGTLYKIKIVKSAQKRSWMEANTSTPYGGKFKYLSDSNSLLNSTNTIAPIGGIEYSYYTYTLQYVSMQNEDITYEIPADRSPCLDAPYDMFAIPAGPMRLSTGNYSSEITSRRLLEDLIIKLGDKLYDVQYLPYYPETKGVYVLGGVAQFDPTELPDNCVTLVAPNDPEAVYPLYRSGRTVIIYPRYSQLSFSLDNTIPAKQSILDIKVSNECDLYRICSPNYNGQFEFSAAKNGGVSGFNVSYTLKPFSPYIKVAPIFNQLYGGNFGDARGLICGGDFSLSQIESAWQNYEINNKNYQVMFDRQIQNMEVNNSIERTRERVAAVTGTIGGAVTGGVSGAIASGGNPYAAAAGAVIGGVASGIGGAFDLKLNERLRREAIDYTKDQFGYQLQNIKALPYSLTKVGTQNTDFKVFPFIEYYTCTDVEKSALINKIKYNGMTVMRIGAIADFIQPEPSYIKGKLIRLESIYDDYHVVNMIAKELNEGVFI